MSTPGPRVEQTAPYINNASATVPRYTTVIQDTSDEGLFKLPTAANERPLGVTEYETEEGENGSIVREGYWWAIAAAAISIGDTVVINGTAGKVKTDPATSTTVSHQLGVAETAAGADGDHIIVRLRIQSVYNP